ncbi:MAG: response regulator [Methanobacteriota archaeon]
MDSPECILIVDDEESQRKTLSFIFKKKGYLTESAGTGKEALEIASGRLINLVLLDINLPDTEGIELIAPLKQINQDMAIIMVTGFASVENTVLSMNAGASGYLVKPINNDEMLGNVHDLLERQALIRERRQAEEALKESEILLNEVGRMARVGGWELDVFTKGVYWTKETYRIHDISEAENYDLSQAALFYDMPGRTVLEKAIQRCIEDKEPFDLELPFTSAKSRHLWARSIGRAVTANGIVVKLVGAFQDITERKRVENEITFKNAILSTQQESSPDGILVVDNSGKIISFNQRFKTLWLIPDEIIESREDEQVLRSVLDNLQDPDEFLTRVTYLYEHPDEKSHEEIYLADGRILERFSAPMYGDDGNYFGRVWHFGDITDLKNNERRIQESEEYLQTIFNSVSAGVIIINPGTHTIYDANPAALHIIGAEKKEVIGSICHQFICPSMVNQCPITDLHQEIDDIEWVLKTVDHKLIPIMKTVVPVTLKGNQYLLESFIDISALKNAESALQKANEKLNHLASINRHDILNQLTALLGYLEMLNEDVSNPDQMNMLKKASISAQQIHRLIDFSRDYQDIGIKAAQWVNIHDMIRSALMVFSRSGIRITIDLEGLFVFADGLLEKVFYNLADNSIRHGESVSTITVIGQRDERGFCIIFSDDGVGITNEEKKNLFKKGYGKNTGMGLFLIREILSITDITIEETGEPGKGVRFEILVPEGKYRIGE